MAAWQQGAVASVPSGYTAHVPDGEVQEAAARVGLPLDGHWDLVHLIAVGGTAAVYEAVDPYGQRAAIKLLSRHWMAPDNLLAQARYEAELMHAVGHPGVVLAGEASMAQDGSVYLPMELLEGETLEDRRQRHGGKLPHHEVLSVIDSLLDVVAYAHDHAIVHHDLKPGNVFLTRDGKVKLLDFGLARRGSDGTTPTVWFGTPGFVAPEQARGQLSSSADGRVDVWGLGATMFVTLSGEPVHLAQTPVDEVKLAGTEPVRSLREAAPWMPRAVVEAVDRALALSPDERFQDVRDLRAALRGPAPVTARPREEPGSGVHRVARAQWRRDNRFYWEHMRKACAW